MAKWGEGDPRWIVEERADATNVNNWHWTERDVSGWSCDCLRRLLLGVRIQGAEGACTITDVSRLDGEASINNRKGKLIYIYEWALTANWLGTSCSGVKFRGSLEVSNLSDENDLDELDISAALAKDTPPTPLLDLMKTRGVQEVRRALGDYITQLKSEFSDGMILPTKPTPTQPNKEQTGTTQVTSSHGPAPKVTSSSSPSSFTLTETFETTADELYKTFTTQMFVEAFTRSAAVVDGCRGGRFQMMDGSVSGTFTQLVPDQKIGMKWRFRTWPKDHHADVMLTFAPRAEQTELTVTFDSLPVGTDDITREGWRRFYFIAIKQTFGY